MQITGTVVSKTLSKQIKGTKGFYEGWELIYKDLQTDEVKTINKPSQSLKNVPGLADALNALAEGDKFIYEIEKVGSFWEIRSLTKGELATPLPTRKEWTGGGKNQATRDYETKAERTTRQRLIVRQSSITAALTAAEQNKIKDIETILNIAEQFENWVFRGL